jgi:NAD+ kinase
MKIGILHHPQVPGSYELAQEIEAWLQTQGVEAWECISWEAERTDGRLVGLDLLITLGGDGSMLRAGRLASHFDIPILGINMGRLGFLAEIYPDEWRKHMPRVLKGDYRIERRHMLQAEVWRDGELIEQNLDALNEVVVARGGLTRVVRITTEINESYLTTYVADGVIVSTPTGSTAYALAVGGPILPPELRNILLLPIAPHLSLARPLVLDKGAVVTLIVHTDHKAILTVDGQFLIDMEDGDRVMVTSGPNVASFVRLQPRSYFYRTLMDRLKWIV